MPTREENTKAAQDREAHARLLQAEARAAKLTRTSTTHSHFRVESADPNSLGAPLRITGRRKDDHTVREIVS
jgi:hypothetical protein